jgi:hypothetical protein
MLAERSEVESSVASHHVPAFADMMVSGSCLLSREGLADLVLVDEDRMKLWL